NTNPSNLPSIWNSLMYDDVSWPSGGSGFGYGDGDDQTVIPNGTISIALRKHFQINTVSEVKRIVLHMDYDDAFVAYINGKEIARANIGVAGQQTSFTDQPVTDHEAVIYNGGRPDIFVIDHVEDFLETGDNVIAIQGHNLNANTS